MRVSTHSLFRQLGGWKNLHVDGLEPSGWDQQWWTIDCTRYLLYLCSIAKVKYLDFIPKQGSYRWNFEGIKLDDNLPLQLKEVSVHFDSCRFPCDMAILFERAKIKQITCRFVRGTGHTKSEMLISFNAELMKAKWLDKNYSLRKIKFFDTDGTKCFSDWGTLNTTCMAEVGNILIRNRKSFKKCQLATMIFLSKRIGKYHQVDHNVCKIIAQQVWATRGTKIWNIE